MSQREETHHPVLLANRNALVVGKHGGVVLSVGEYDTLRIACCSAGIKDVSYIVVVCLLAEDVHLTLSRETLAEFQELVEVHRAGVVGVFLYSRVKDDNLLKRRTKRQHTICLVVLFLFANEEDAYLRIANHKLYLLLTTRSVEGNGDSTYSESTEVGKHILNDVLREDSHILLNLNVEVQHGVAHLTYSFRECLPRTLSPLRTAEITIFKHRSLAVLLCLLVY